MENNNNNNCNNCNNPAPLEFIRHPSDGGGGIDGGDCLTDVTDDGFDCSSPDIDNPDPDDPTRLVLATPRRSVWPESVVNKPLRRTEYIIC